MTQAALPAPFVIPDAAKPGLGVLFIAKHALGDGTPHAEDGSHAVYHHEVKSILEGLGLKLTLADTYRVLFEDPQVDFVFPLLNRGGFLNSEMLLPLLCTRLGIPFLGASPILRGVSDDKHLSKLVAQSLGVPTLDWAIYRRGQKLDEARLPMAERYVVKPNASSASWGVSSAIDWVSVKSAVESLHDQGHDAIVEPFLSGDDIEVSIISRNGEPLILPTMIVRQQDPQELRSYSEKRNLGGAQSYAIEPFEDDERLPEIHGYARRVMAEFAPFDYGRFEMRMDRETGALQFLEINLNCNLWSKKTISIAAQRAGWTHVQLIEHILAEALARNGLIKLV